MHQSVEKLFHEMLETIQIILRAKIELINELLFSSAQNELVLPNLINNEDHCKTEESERASDAGKEAMCGNLVASFVNQEPGEINIEEDRYNVRGEVQEEEEEKTREIRTLNLFPVLENQEKTDWFAEKKKANANRMCYNYRYYYEFMPLKKN